MSGEIFSIRPAVMEDLPALLKLYRQLNPADPDLEPHVATERFAAMLDQPGLTVFVGFTNATLVSCCMLIVTPNLTRGATPFALIENVVTHADHRKRGYGRAVLRHAVEHAFAQDCYKVMLLTGRSRAEVLRFYEQSSFRQDKAGFQIRRPGL